MYFYMQQATYCRYCEEWISVCYRLNYWYQRSNLTLNICELVGGKGSLLVNANIGKKLFLLDRKKQHSLRR